MNTDINLTSNNNSRQIGHCFTIWSQYFQCLASSAFFCDDTYQCGILAPFSRCCENQLEACCLCASIRNVYLHLSVSTKAL